MTATGKSLLKHPLRDKIDERLLAGEALDDVVSWLNSAAGGSKERRKRFAVSRMTLQAYRKNFLNLDGDVLRELKRERQVKIQKERERRQLEIVQSSDNYQLAKARYAENYVRQIEDTDSRLEDLYTKLLERIDIMEAQPTSHLNDKVIVEYLRLAKDIVKEYWDKQHQIQVESETNITIDVRRITEEQRILKEAIREVFLEMCPDMLPNFLEKLSEKLRSNTVLQDTEDNDESSGPVNINIKA